MLSKNFGLSISYKDVLFKHNIDKTLSLSNIDNLSIPNMDMNIFLYYM